MNLRNDPEIWDDFKYWLENPITDEEQALRDKEINDYINAVITKMYGD